MPNYLVQYIKDMPDDMKYRVVKTQLEVGIFDQPIEVAVPDQEPLYFSTRKTATNCRESLVAQSIEPIVGIFSLMYVTDTDVATWARDSGKYVGTEDVASWYASRSKYERSVLLIAYAVAKAEQELEQAKALGFTSTHQMKNHQRWLDQHGSAAYKAWAAMQANKAISNPPPDWEPIYAQWRGGGSYVLNVRYPSGSVGCVSQNYPDNKWRIVCDARRRNLGEPGDVTFPSRDEAARAEFALAALQHASGDVTRSSTTAEYSVGDRQ